MEIKPGDILRHKLGFDVIVVSKENCNEGLFDGRYTFGYEVHLERFSVEEFDVNLAK